MLELSYILKTFQNLLKSKIHNLFVTSKNEFSNSPIHEFKVLQNVFKIKKQRLKYTIKMGF